ncbi:carbon-nitrogen hydrolase family protein [Corynebacterium ciconiae]|uniref:carbon-nitrogen hydrolase family protein n=1 Tax=Corynebacterium ciconiae TaxID=227319 RepID=UPI000361CB30|nr:carbon-nitrogen hydrolase family protein [Corynebacterium ciconiae]
MKAAVVQILSSDDKDANLTQVLDKAREAAASGAELIVFPEATSQAFGTGRLDHKAEPIDGPFATAVAELAAELDVVIVVGMFCTADTITREGKEINRVDNVALVTGRGVHAGYTKIHCYDAFGFRESDTVRAGTELLVVDVPSTDGQTWRLGCAICFDVRFPEQFKDLAREKGAEVIAVPTSWQDGEGKRQQWRALTTARALDSTCYILASAQARPGGAAKAGEDDGPTGIGHSRVVGPAGQVLAEAGYEPEILYVELDREQLDAARTSIPVLVNEANYS